MLNPFPSLLTYSFFAPTVLRVVAACVIIMRAYSHWRRQAEIGSLLTPLVGKLSVALVWLLILIEAGTGGALFVGAKVQIAAIFGVLLALKSLIVRPRGIMLLSRSSGWLLFAICLALLVLGAGAFAFDIPL